MVHVVRAHFLGPVRVQSRSAEPSSLRKSPESAQPLPLLCLFTLTISHACHKMVTLEVLDWNGQQATAVISEPNGCCLGVFIRTPDNTEGFTSDVLPHLATYFTR